MAKFESLEWLGLWLLETFNFEFQWDQGNLEKSSKKHGIETIEVEEVFQLGMAVPIGIQILPIVSEQRFAILGPTYQGSLIFVVFTIRNGLVRPISSRVANRKEKKTYETLRKTFERIR